MYMYIILESVCIYRTCTYSNLLSMNYKWDIYTYVSFLIKSVPVTPTPEDDSLEEQLAEAQQMQSLWMALAIIFLVIAVSAITLIIITVCLFYKKFGSRDNLKTAVKATKKNKGAPLATVNGTSAFVYSMHLL